MRLLIFDHCCPQFCMDHPSPEKLLYLERDPRGVWRKMAVLSFPGKKMLAPDSRGGSCEQRALTPGGDAPESWTWVGKTGTIHFPTWPRAAPVGPPSWKQQHWRAQPFKNQGKKFFTL